MVRRRIISESIIFGRVAAMENNRIFSVYAVFLPEGELSNNTTPIKKGKLGYETPCLFGGK